MKILPVSLNNYNNISRPVNYKNSAFISSNVNFGGFKDVFKKRTPPSLLTEQEEILSAEKEKSEDIKGLLNTLFSENKELYRQTKAHTKYLKQFYKIGKNHNYKGYIDLKNGSGNKILFGDFNKENNFPNNVSVMDGMKPIFLYNLYGRDLWNIEDFSQPEFDILMQMLKDRVFYYSETDKNTGETRELTPVNKNEFYYQEGKLNTDGQMTQINLEAHVDMKDSSKSYYIEYDNNGEPCEYRYNLEKGLWQVV